MARNIRGVEKSLVDFLVTFKVSCKIAPYNHEAGKNEGCKSWDSILVTKTCVLLPLLLGKKIKIGICCYAIVLTPLLRETMGCNVILFFFLSLMLVSVLILTVYCDVLLPEWPHGCQRPSSRGQ